MDVYTAAKEYLDTILAEWNEIDELLARAIESRPRHWRLSSAVCLAVGGDKSLSIPAVAALASIYLGIILIDDMLDADPKGYHLRWGHPVTANIASALHSAGLEAIAHSSFAGRTKELMLSNLSQMILQTAIGQHMDMQNPQDEESYWAVTRAKSSPFFASSFFAGALAGGAEMDMACSLEQIGELYGEMVQIHDDVNDVMEAPANPDWIQGRSPLPILFAQVVDHPEREQFLQLRSRVREPDALAQAQQILIRCGGISYALHALLLRYNWAMEKLNRVDLPHQSLIIDLFSEVIAPIRGLLDGVSEEKTLV